MSVSVLHDLFAELDRYADVVPLHVLRRWCATCPLEYEDLAEFARFDPERYQRNLLYTGQAFHALLLCWQSGQRSPIHDHQGSNCLVKVLRGQPIETAFARGPHGIYPVQSHTLRPGQITASSDTDVHQVSNLTGGDVVTLHVYSPPLFYMHVYSLETPAVTRVYESVHQFAQGGGI